MIGYLRGTVVRRSGDQMVVDVGGVGYLVSVPAGALEKLGRQGAAAELHVHTVVREDQLALFGFLRPDELDLFELLIQVDGVGPKVGLAILSTASLDVLRRAILAGEVGPIRKTPGVGPRTAQKVIIDLQPKLAAQAGAAGLVQSVSDGGGAAPDQRAAQVEEALRGLGFAPALAKSGVAAVDWRAEPTPEEALATALRSLGEGSVSELVRPDEEGPEEEQFDRTLRPQHLADYIGQESVKENLGILLEAARRRGEPVEHILLSGPPGLGKTTLATIIANELGVQIRTTSGPAIDHAGALGSLLTNLSDRDVLFIDEVHRLQTQVEEALYPALEDFTFDFVAGKGAGAMAMQLPLAHFTCVGATTRQGLLSAPLRDRFGAVYRLDFYTAEELERILARSARLLNFEIEPAARSELAKRSRGTPRVANRLLRWVRDYAQVRAEGRGTLAVAGAALASMDIDEIGLDTLDRRLLETIVTAFRGGPVGLDTIAVSLAEEPATIEDVHEPFLIQLGFLARTPRGRVATALAYRHLGLPPPDEGPKQSLLPL